MFSFFPSFDRRNYILTCKKLCLYGKKTTKTKNYNINPERRICFLGDCRRLTKSSDLLTVVWYPGKWPKWNRTLQLMVFSCCYQSVLSMGHLQRGWTKSVWPSPYQWHDSDKTVSTGKVSLRRYYISHGYFNCHLSLLCC